MTADPHDDLALHGEAFWADPQVLACLDALTAQAEGSERSAAETRLVILDAIYRAAPTVIQAQVDDMRAAGTTWREIAQALDLNVSTVHQRFTESGRQRRAERARRHARRPDTS